jgi:hypothetical protein
MSLRTTVRASLSTTVVAPDRGDARTDLSAPLRVTANATRKRELLVVLPLVDLRLVIDELAFFALDYTRPAGVRDHRRRLRRVRGRQWTGRPKSREERRDCGFNRCDATSGTRSWNLFSGAMLYREPHAGARVAARVGVPVC